MKNPPKGASIGRFRSELWLLIMHLEPRCPLPGISVSRVSASIFPVFNTPRSFRLTTSFPSTYTAPSPPWWNPSPGVESGHSFDCCTPGFGHILFTLYRGFSEGSVGVARGFGGPGPSKPPRKALDTPSIPPRCPLDTTT